MNAIAIDIETTGLAWDVQVLCVSAAWRDPSTGALASDSRNLAYTDLFTQPSTVPEVRAWLRGLCSGVDWYVFHNASFDIPYLLHLGLLDDGQLQDMVFDTLLLSRMTGKHNDGASLEALTREWDIRVEDPEWYSRMKGLRRKLIKADPAEVLRYAEVDTQNTLRLFEKVLPLAETMYTREQIVREGNYALCVSRMRRTGIKVDRERVGYLLEEYTKQIKHLTLELAPHRIKGPSDDAGFIKLLERWGFTYDLETTKGGRPKVSEKSLMHGIPGLRSFAEVAEVAMDAGPNKLDPEQRAIEERGRANPRIYVPWMILHGRELVKRRSTWLQGYLDRLDDAGRIHPLWGAGGTVSYRLNCTEPNAQAIPPIMDILTARDGYELWELDLSQAELRLMAGYGLVNTMAAMFASGRDIHAETAVLMRGVPRTTAKRANFGAAYAVGVNGLMEQLDIGEDEARKVLAMHRRVFPEIPAISKKAEKRWLERGYIESYTGKRLYGTDFDLEVKSYKAFNQVIQMGIAEILEDSMLDIERFVPEVFICGQVHDSLLVEVPAEQVDVLVPRCLEIMSAAAPVRILGRTKPPITMEVDRKRRANGGPERKIDASAIKDWFHGYARTEESRRVTEWGSRKA